MSRADRFALLLCAAAVLVSAQVASGIFENMAHLEDEFAYVWQAQAIARGDLTVPSPEFSSSFLVPFVVDYQGQRFGKYPLGWPVLLSFGVRVGARSWVNPLLAGLAVWLIYRLGKHLQNETVGLLAAGLTVTSPFFLMNTGSLLSHPWSMVLTSIFLLTWMEGVAGIHPVSSIPPWLPPALSGLALGLLGLTRPLTMAAVAVPYGLHGLYLLLRGDGGQRKRVVIVGIVALLLSSFHFVWQYALTGHFFKSPYTLWWPYDTIGFGPGHGVVEGGHTLQLAWWNTKHSLRTGLSDLFGWGKLSWLFLPLGLWALRKNGPALIMGTIPFSLVALYAAYWVGSWLFGPRYYFSGFPAAAVFTAAGIVSLAGWSMEKGASILNAHRGWRMIRPLLTVSLVALLVAANLVFYLPSRLDSMRGLYNIEREDLRPFTSQKFLDLSPALFIVHTERWMGYGNYLELTTPYLDSPFLFAWSIGPKTDGALARAYRGRRDVYHYYPDRPWAFYTRPLPGTY